MWTGRAPHPGTHILPCPPSAGVQFYTWSWLLTASDRCAEGYTNFLHILLTGGLGALGLDLVVAARLVNGTAFVVMVLMLTAYVLLRQKVDGQARRSTTPGFSAITRCGTIRAFTSTTRVFAISSTTVCSRITSADVEAARSGVDIHGCGDDRLCRQFHYLQAGAGRGYH